MECVMRKTSIQITDAWEKKDLRAAARYCPFYFNPTDFWFVPASSQRKPITPSLFVSWAPDEAIRQQQEIGFYCCVDIGENTPMLCLVGLLPLFKATLLCLGHGGR